MISRRLLITSLSLAAFAAAGCTADSQNGGLRQQLGLSQAPDEFLIIARDPIEVPASFDLPRPEPGAPSRVEIDPIADAHSALFQRERPVRLATASPGESVLLSGADAEGDNSGIRNVLEDEDPFAGERQFGLTSFLGVPVPASLEEAESALDSIEETQELRRQGLPTPAAPPPDEDRETGIRFIEN